MDAANHHSLPRDIAEDESPACQSCRKRKLRCSRELPACTHCLRLDLGCIYDTKRNKPGIKAGVMETLSRRIDVLEEAMSLRTTVPPTGSKRQRLDQRIDTDALADILASIARDLKRFPSADDVNLTHQPNKPSEYCSSRSALTANPSRLKRHCLNSRNSSKVPVDPIHDGSQDPSGYLPSPKLMNHCIDIYFSRVQPWIPLLHETRFRDTLNDPERRDRKLIILHAMVVAVIRLIPGLSSAEIHEITNRCREVVLLRAFDGLSVAHLQALAIVVFTDMGRGQAARVWAIVGSLSRTVDYLQLSVEIENEEERTLLRPHLSICPADSWTEEEERRRVFWVVFQLDRMCSVMTGWSTSLTSTSVERRLPADGDLWHESKAVQTPYFGTWDKSAAEIGRPAASLPEYYSSPDQSFNSTDVGERPLPGPDSSPTAHLSNIGAFAFCVEATESLSRVNECFLKQKVSLKDRADVWRWLVQFRELDYRLVLWKKLLPSKWRDTDVSRQPGIIEMDPNLTLAHLTHESALILLHAKIAYPSADLAGTVQLPSMRSASTCYNAAVKVSTISHKYMSCTPRDRMVSTQFGFCLYIGARLFLVHSVYYGIPNIATEFATILGNLEELSRRWAGKGNVFAKYGEQLRLLQRKISEQPRYHLDVLGYVDEVNAFPEDDMIFAPIAQRFDSGGQKCQPSDVSPGVVKRMSPVSSLARDFDPDTGSYGGLSMGNGISDELTGISDILLGQKFLEMDRIITYDDSMFAVDTTWPTD